MKKRTMQNWRNTKNSSILLILFLLPAWLWSQTTSFINYGVEQGLVQSQVQSLVQDNEGNLWVGTLSGLSKYNGRTFQSFSRKDGLAEDWVTVSYKDTHGDLWFGHWAGGVSRYNVNRHKFESLNLEEYTRFKTVTAIQEDPQGYYWIATEGSGIFIYDPGKNKMFALNVKDGIASPNVFDLSLDKYGNMWIATDNGITIFDTHLDVSSPASFTDLNAARGFPSNAITCFAQANEGNEMWAGTADSGVVVLQLPNGFAARNASVLLPTYKVISFASGLAGNFVEALCADKRGFIWVGTVGGGVTKIMPAKSPNRSTAIDNAILKNYNTRQGLNYFNVRSLLEDREGNVWIGTDVGLNEYRGERFQLFDRQDGLNNDIVWATCTDRAGNIWLGTNNGLTKMSFYRMPGTNEQRFTIRNYSTADGLGSNVILSLYEDAQGNVWAGTGFGGVSKLTPGSNTFQTYTTADGLAGNIVYAINSDPKGNIWIGTKEGVSKFDPTTGTFRNYTTEDGLGGNNVYRIFRDSQGRLWFGALGGYLSVYDGKSFTRYDETSGIIHRFILSIGEDKDHNLWFGAYGGGVYLFDGRKFRNFTTSDGLATETPYAIITDKENNVWVGNSRGLDLYNRADSTFRHFGRGEGFLGVEVNPNAACIDNEGNLWFGTIMGAVKFDARENKKNTVEPITSVSGLKIFMRDAEFPDDARFTYDQNHLTFQFVGVCLSSPEKVRYKYKLEGFDKDWSPLPTNINEAVYSNLPPGEYTFLVKAENNDGVWNAKPVEYKFFIKPPFWQTAFFYIVMALLVIFCIYGFDKWRTRKLQKQKKILEEKVEQRTLELAIKNEELAQRNKEVTDSIRYAKRLQDTMLLPGREIKTALPDSFILYKPKDIVSGDFYFFRMMESNGQKRAFIAAVDCTGHGVPGAFMSIITNDMILQAIEGKQNASPAEILNRLNRLMTEKMRHSVDELRIRDGVDIALVSLNLETRELQFSGAYNSMFLFKGKQFQEFKGDKISIGSANEDSTSSYINQTIQLEQGDTFYLFSDGYADQFGGPQGKKFKTAQLKAVLLGMQNSDLREQGRMLEQTIENWRGSLEQVDDMLVIGVRV